MFVLSTSVKNRINLSESEYKQFILAIDPEHRYSNKAKELTKIFMMISN